MTSAARDLTGDAATVSAVLQDAARRLRVAGIDGAARDAEVLFRHATGWTAEDLLARPDAALSQAQYEGFQALIARRLNREPVSRIIGMREFWSLPLRVSEATLVPRPDSETVVEAALQMLDEAGVSRHAAIRIIDFGTGTGCLLLALLHELPKARGLGVDGSGQAIAVARANAADLGFATRARFEVWDWNDDRPPGPGADFDLAVANPPYIPEAELATLMPEVARFEPRRALDGGPDGLDGMRRLAIWFPRLVRPNAAAVVEVGAGQAGAVEAILRRAGGRDLKRFRDLAGIDRCIGARFG